MTTSNDGGGSMRDQLRQTAGEAWPISEEADVMARALFALHFADQWLAEQVELSLVEMRGDGDQVRRRFTRDGRTVDLVLESDTDLRITGSTSPAAAGWVMIRSGDEQQLVRLDEDGMFTAVVPSDAGVIDLVLEFDDGQTMTMTDIAA